MPPIMSTYSFVSLNGAFSKVKLAIDPGELVKKNPKSM
jgi:hypothetical protein